MDTVALVPDTIAPNRDSHGTLGTSYTADLTRLLTYWHGAFHDAMMRSSAVMAGGSPAASSNR